MDYRRFKMSDIDQTRLMSSVNRELSGIIDSAKRNNDNRSIEEIRASTIKGHAVEIFLQDHMHFSENTKLYHDVISPNGTAVECKCIDEEWADDYWIRQDPYGRNLKKWIMKYKNGQNDASLLVLYSVSKDMKEFKYYSTYDFDKFGVKCEFPK